MPDEELEAEVTIRPLSARPEAVGFLAERFKAEWPDFFAGRPAAEIGRTYFGVGQGEELPVVLVGEVDGQLCGTVGIRPIGPDTHPGPWVSGLWVDQPFRGRGVGSALTRAIVTEGARRGIGELYAATESARGLFRRLGWEELGDVLYHGVPVAVFRYRSQRTG